MKKLISVLLAMLMIFSVATVAFAEDAETGEDATTSNVENPGDENAEESKSLTIEDINAYLSMLEVAKGVSKPIKVVAKIVVKLAIVAIKLHIISVEQVMDFIQGIVGDQNADDENTDDTTVENVEAPEENVEAA